MATKNTSKPVNMGGLDALAGFGDMSFGNLIEGAGAPAPPAPVPAEPTGAPKYVKTSDIEEDERQIRKRFNLDEMRASIRENKAAGRAPIKTPLIVKTHPTKPGKWKLCDGGRRKRSAVLEDVDELPIVIDENFDDFDQVAVNLQRDDNTPVEIADFIAQKLGEGIPKGVIAARLGQSKSWVSKHVKLIGMPQSIRRAYDEFRINDVEAMYLLVNAYPDFPAEVDSLCATGTETISKYTVMSLLDSLKNPTATMPAPAGEAVPDPAVNAPDGLSVPPIGADTGDTPSEPVPGLGHEMAEQRQEVPDQANEDRVDENQGEPAAQQQPTTARPSTKVDGPASEPSGVQVGTKDEATPAKLRKAIVQVQHDERPARLILDRRAAVGLAWIKYDDDGAEVEIDIGTARLVAIIDGA